MITSYVEQSVDILEISCKIRWHKRNPALPINPPWMCCIPPLCAFNQAGWLLISVIGSSRGISHDLSSRLFDHLSSASIVKFKRAPPPSGPVVDLPLAGEVETQAARLDGKLLLQTGTYVFQEKPRLLVLKAIKLMHISKQALVFGFAEKRSAAEARHPRI
ncbi:hypothetical protein NM208_g10730 [Fusarium decemcellulare]|uniref:Uncharacterized protein n=1 Tax=Fusarium decemcellulare TaxID=57161 RepID=A0ACC1RWU1_9HYPO|nr:hypothetical protein NM208_g10730 [Fusarium decemcellulare]